MTLAEAIRQMDLTELTCLQEAIQELAHARRAVLADQYLMNKGLIGILQPVKKKGSRKVIRRARVNATVLEYSCNKLKIDSEGFKEHSRGKFKIEVIEPEGFAGQTIEASEELVYERFGSPG